MSVKIGIIAFDTFHLHQAVMPTSLFEASAVLDPTFGSQDYSCTMLSEHGGLVTSSSGVRVETTAASAAGAFDHIVIPDGVMARAAASSPLLQAFVAAHRYTAKTISAVADGTFLLAASGLLNGRQAAVHWLSRADLAAEYPDVVIEQDPVIKDGPIITGSMTIAGAQIARLIFEREYGSAAMKRAAQECFSVQSLQSFPVPGEDDDTARKFMDVIKWARCNLSRSLTVELLAERLNMTPHHFGSAFTLALGATPAKVIEHLRVEAAIALLKSGDQPIASIAAKVGFSNVKRMRGAFMRIIGRAPQSVRATTGVQRSARAAADAERQPMSAGEV